jgi:hypothetical protein
MTPVHRVRSNQHRTNERLSRALFCCINRIPNWLRFSSQTVIYWVEALALIHEGVKDAGILYFATNLRGDYFFAFFAYRNHLVP